MSHFDKDYFDRLETRRSEQARAPDSQSLWSAIREFLFAVAILAILWLATVGVLTVTHAHVLH